MSVCASFSAVPRSGSVIDDQELLLRSASGDTWAFERLFRRHRSALQGFLYRKLRSHEEAEDAVVLTFCKAWRFREGFRGSASGKAWLYRIATRVAIDLLRRRTVTAELEPLLSERAELLEEDVVDPEELLLEGERLDLTRRAVQRAMEGLPGAEQRLLRLFYFEGRSYEEISTLTGISRSQVRGRLHRIRARIRQDLIDQRVEVV
jgi:RNA polymerase sigma-70 factor, ECF subfamily